MKHLRVGDLISILEKFDKQLPVLVTDEGKDHQFGLSEKGIEILENPYFPSDEFKDFNNDIKYVNLGYF